MLEKVFIKDRNNTEDKNVRSKYGNLAGFLGISTNLVLGVVKLIVGFISHSVSIMADAVNNISDMATSAMTILGFKLANKKPNREHPYGYARYEYVCSFVIALFMFAMGVVFAKESVVKIFSPEELVIDKATYIVLGCAVLVKLFQLIEYKSYADAIKSQAIEATALDTRNDIITTTGILISMVVMGIFKINIDGYVGLAVSGLVIISSIGAIKEGLEPIIGIVPTKEQVDAITEKLKSYPIVKGIHDMVIHNYGVNNDFVTVHVEVDSRDNVLDIHDAIDIIENDFRNDMGLPVTIHMDPVVIGDKELDNYKEQVEELLKNLDERLMFHDFRMVKGPSHTNIIFDCVVPQDDNWDSAFISEYLSKNVKSKSKLFFVVEIDRPYC